MSNLRHRATASSSSSSSSSSRVDSRPVSGGTVASPATPRWLSENPAKAAGERFFLLYSLFWIPLVAVVVGGGVFESIDALRETDQQRYEWGYMLIGMAVGLPCMLLPVLFPLEAERHLPLLERYTTKANVWIWIVGFASNYFWTHYFENVLRTCYNFYSFNLNGVPFNLYLITHSYFASYHAFSNIVIRRMWHVVGNRSTWANRVKIGVFLVVLTYVTAFGEAYTIQAFPHYKYPDARTMWMYGSIFYALYFVVSFPMFLRLDERRGENWSMSRAIIDACATSFMITFVLDLWRLGLGPLYDNPPPASQLCPNANYGAASAGPPPFIQ